jgi:hypothetical protein
MNQHVASFLDIAYKHEALESYVDDHNISIELPPETELQLEEIGRGHGEGMGSGGTLTYR